jgi:short-subunit dehydrogenase
MNQPAQQWALVSGASSGLGIELARALAVRGFNLILTARREEPMRQLAAELQRRHGIEIVVEPLDLAAPSSAIDLQKRLEQRSIEPSILINNAGYGLNSEFIVESLDRLRAMLQVDIMTLTELTHIFGKRMAERGHGYILLVASGAAYQPTPFFAAYGAAKAYVLSLGEALHVELAPKVGVTVLSPGPMETGFADTAGTQMPDMVKSLMLQTAKVAQIGLGAMFDGKSSVIAGRLNSIMAFTNRFTSRRFQARATSSLAKKSQRSKS